jgi:hypothetical protein
MGGTSSKQKMEEFQKEYEEIKTEYSQHFGELVISKKRTNKNIKVMSKQVIINDSSIYKEFQRKLNERKNLRTDKVACLLKVIGNVLKLTLPFRT